ncbi:MAG: helix-turn-helix transcriptional regulator [Pseudomonadota bacterium]
MSVGDLEKKFSFLPNKLSASRREKGWSRIELAKRIGRTEEAVSAIECGEIRHELGTVYLICDELGLSFRDMFRMVAEEPVVIPFPERSRL